MKNSFTFVCNKNQQKMLCDELSKTKYQLTQVPHTIISANNGSCNINLYHSGKLLIQGKGASEWVTFILEPNILQKAEVGYEEILNPESREPHMGIDESGKGDFFGPLVVASAYVNEELVKKLEDVGVRDSKMIKSDTKIIDTARNIKKILGNRFAIISIGPNSYNGFYEKVKNINKILAWGHAQAIENLLEKVPDCPRALSDKFGPSQRIENALMEKGKTIIVDQRTKAESDPAVAAASILARAAFIYSLKKMGKELQIEIPKGCSEKVKEVALKIISQHKPTVLLQISKSHFKTTDQILNSLGYSRSDLT